MAVVDVGELFEVVVVVFLAFVGDGAPQGGYSVENGLEVGGGRVRIGGCS